MKTIEEIKSDLAKNGNNHVTTVFVDNVEYTIYEDKTRHFICTAVDKSVLNCLNCPFGNCFSNKCNKHELNENALILYNAGLLQKKPNFKPNKSTFCGNKRSW